MEDDADYRARHGLPVRSFAPGPFRPKSASAKQQPHPVGELTWQSHMDDGQRAGFDDLPGHDFGTSFLLDETGHWIEPEVQEYR